MRVFVSFSLVSFFSDTEGGLSIVCKGWQIEIEVEREREEYSE